MCDPIIGAAVISAAASVAGGVMQGQAQKAAVEAQNQLQRQAMERSARLREEEFRRQAARRGENQDVLNKTIDRYEGTNQYDELRKAQQDRAQEALGASDKGAYFSPDVAALPSSTSGSEIVSDDLSKRLAVAAQRSRDRLTALANLGGYDENFSNQAQQDQIGNRQINMVNNIRQGSLAATNSGVSLINSNVGKADPADLVPGQIVAGIGRLGGRAVSGGVFG